jgi:hypothetical protein
LKHNLIFGSSSTLDVQRVRFLLKIHPLAISHRFSVLDPKLWVRPLAIVGVLLLSIALPLVAAPNRLILFLGLLLAAAAALVVTRWPALGLASLILISLFMPSPNMPGGLNIAVLFLILLVGLWLLGLIVGKSPTKWVSSRTFRPLLFFMAISVLAFGVGQFSWFFYAQHAPLDTQLGGLAILLLSAGAFLLVAHQLHDLRWLQILTWLFVASGSLQIIGWLVPALGRYTSRLFQLGTSGNSLFWVWLTAISLSQAVFNRRLHVIWRFTLGCLVLATWYVGFVLNYGWKSGWLPPLVSIAIILGLLSWRIGLGVALTGLVIGPALATKAINTDLYSYSTRFEAWSIMLEIIKVNPILGLGPANYRWYTPLFPIEGYYVRFNSHNNYIDIVAQTGLLGLACFSWFAWEVGRLGWCLRNQAQEGFERAYVYGALGGLGGMLAAAMIADWVIPFVYNIGFSGFRASMLGWMFLGGLVSIEHVVRSRSNP